MPLTGLSPSRRTPGFKREFQLGVGQSSGTSPLLPVLLYGNKTSAGSETVDTIGTPILDDADCIVRFGRKSELRTMYRKYIAIDPGATIYGVAVTESAGTAATRTITWTGTATATTTAIVTVLGVDVEFTVNSGDVAATVAASATAAINAADDGSLPLTASTSTADTVLTASQKSPRSDYFLAQVRVRVRDPNAGITASVAAISSGTTADDFSAAITAASLGEWGIQVTPWFLTTAPTSTDNGIGEHATMIKTQALPINGKTQVLFAGLVGTQAQCTTVATDSDINSEWVKLIGSKNHDWTPGMLAASYAAACRSECVAYPAANLANYPRLSGQLWGVPAPYAKSNWWTTTEIETLLADGVTPLGAKPTGDSFIVRDVTSRTVNAQSAKDYRASEGHIPFVVGAFWSILSTRLQEQMQPGVANNPTQGQKPLPLFTTPADVQAIVRQAITDGSSANAYGLYPSAILDPSPDVVETSLASVVATKRAGGISWSCSIFSGQHLLFLEGTIREAGPAY